MRLKGLALAFAAVTVLGAPVSLAAPPYQDAIQFAVDTVMSKNLFWDVAPVLGLHLENKGTETLPSLTCDLRAVDEYYEREVWAARYTFPEVHPGGRLEQAQETTVPYGVFRVKWSLTGAEGEVGTGTLDIARMLPRCYRDMPEAVRTYDRRWSLFGGVFGFYAPELATDMGTRWNRFEDVVWDRYEKEPGLFDMTELVARVKRWKDVGIECVMFQTIYQHPAFCTPEQPAFARAYGLAMQHTAEAVTGLSDAFELGNEDNGPTKMLYTELARNGAAGIRSKQAGALIANSGTAYIDVNWLNMQASRNLFDVLDVVCTHPYTAGESPETWKVYEKLQEVNDVVDSVGGMKLQWTTEFGWPHDFNQQKRAEWIPRHFIIGASVGVERHGLYTWERDYGVFQGTAQPAAASVHTLAKLTEASRFAGLIQHDDNLWVGVFERAGDPLAVAWSPKGDATWQIPVDAGSAVYDLFGTSVSVEVHDGMAAIHVTGAPIYVAHPHTSVLEAAYTAQTKIEVERFLKCLKAADGKDISAIWSVLAGRSDADGEMLRKALCEWQPSNGAVSPCEQAIAAQVLRWYWVAGRVSDAGETLIGRQELAARHEAFRKRLEDSVIDDADIPSLRYLLNRWSRLADEEDVAHAYGAEALASRLLSMQGTVAQLCGRFSERGCRVGFALWPYLYGVKQDGTLCETLRFIPGQKTTALLRATSFSRNDRGVSVSFDAPAGWVVEPVHPELTVKAGQTAETEVCIACPVGAAMEHPVFRAVLHSEGLPERETVFDDTFVEAPLQIALDPVEGLLPATPVNGHLTNVGTQPLNGLVRIVCRGDTRALGRIPFADLSPGNPLDFTCAFSSRATPPPYHEWPLSAEIIVNGGRRISRALEADFACAVRAESPPTINGDLSEWTCAAPLHLAREAYGKGSFSGKWTPEDCSATTYLMWDDAYLYFAAVVRDQTFNQMCTGTAIWTQDSIQLALARDANSPYNGLGLALTPQGEQVVAFGSVVKDTSGSRLKVVPEQGRTTYEAAIPWAQVAGLEKPLANTTLRYNVLVNDDDAVIGRRFLERYGGIAYDNNVEHLGNVRLLAETGRPITNPLERPTLFVEDFEEYDSGVPPDAWETMLNLQPFPEMSVQDGVGRNGSKGLVLTNSIGQKPNVFRLIVRQLEEVHAGQACEMHFWARGHGLEAPSSIVGICSDKWGNEAFSYADLTGVDDDWREIHFAFSGPSGGNINIIVRNTARIEELVLDDFRIESRGIPVR